MARTKPEEAIENGVHWMVGLAEPCGDHRRHRAGHIMDEGQLASSATRANLYLGANTDSDSDSQAAEWCMMKRYQGHGCVRAGTVRELAERVGGDIDLRKRSMVDQRIQSLQTPESDNSYPAVPELLHRGTE